MSSMFTSQVSTFAVNLKYICSTFEVHLQYICSTFAVHLKYICSTFAVNLQYIFSTFVLLSIVLETYMHIIIAFKVQYKNKYSVEGWRSWNNLCNSLSFSIKKARARTFLFINFLKTFIQINQFLRKSFKIRS